MTPRTKKIVGSVLVTLGLFGLLVVPQAIQAQQIFPPITPQCDQELKNVNGFRTIPQESRCDLNDFIQLFINLFDWGLALLSILSVVFFIIGGAYLLLSAGNEQRVKTGKSILVNTSLGVGIALSSWLIINTIIGVLVGSGTFSDVRVFGETWWGTPSSCSYTTECSQYETTQGCVDISTQYISQIQRMLREAGCGTIEADGCFGPISQAALVEFNQKNGITPENIATQETWTALNSGKNCESGATAEQLAPGTGCCVPVCGTGIANIEKENGSNGCLDLYPSAYYFDNQPCSTRSLATPSGCCVRSSASEGFPIDTCVPFANEEWCVGGPAGGDGVYYRTSCDSRPSCSGKINNICE